MGLKTRGAQAHQEAANQAEDADVGRGPRATQMLGFPLRRPARLTDSWRRATGKGRGQIGYKDEL